MAILSIDPGGTTGIACMIGDDISTCTCTTKEEVWDFVLMDQITTVIIERFSTSDYLSKYGLHTIEIVGGVKALCHALQKELIVHTPQNRYSFQDIAHTYLKEKKEAFVIHEEDALAHMMYYLRVGK